MASEAPAEMAPGNEPADPQPTPQAAPEAQPQQQQQGADYTALQQQLNDLAPSIESLRDTLSQTWAQNQQQEQGLEQPPEVAPPDLAFLSPEQPQYDENQAAQLLGSVIDQQVQQRLEAATGPLAQRLDDMQLETEASRLAQEFPELEGSGEAIERVFTDAENYAQNIGRPELAGSVPFVRLVYMAGRAAELANEEQSPDVRTATLEGAGGAGAGVAPGGGRVEDALLQGARRNPLPF